MLPEMGVRGCAQGLKPGSRKAKEQSLIERRANTRLVWKPPSAGSSLTRCPARPDFTCVGPGSRVMDIRRRMLMELFGGRGLDTMRAGQGPRSGLSPPAIPVSGLSEFLLSADRHLLAASMASDHPGPCRTSLRDEPAMVCKLHICAFLKERLCLKSSKRVAGNQNALYIQKLMNWRRERLKSSVDNRPRELDMVVSEHKWLY